MTRIDRNSDSGKSDTSLGAVVGCRQPRGGDLDNLLNADIMSDMKTFTVRDLDRAPSSVLEASRVDGRARIRERGGRAYIITPELTEGKPIIGLPDFAKRRRRVFDGVLQAPAVRQLDKALAGE